MWAGGCASTACGACKPACPKAWHGVAAYSRGVHTAVAQAPRAGSGGSSFAMALLSPAGSSSLLARLAEGTSGQQQYYVRYGAGGLAIACACMQATAGHGRSAPFLCCFHVSSTTTTLSAGSPCTAATAAARCWAARGQDWWHEGVGGTPSHTAMHS